MKPFLVLWMLAFCFFAQAETYYSDIYSSYYEDYTESSASSSYYEDYTESSASSSSDENYTDGSESSPEPTPSSDPSSRGYYEAQASGENTSNEEDSYASQMAQPELWVVCEVKEPNNPPTVYEVEEFGKRKKFEVDNYPTPNYFVVRQGECLLKQGDDPNDHYHQVTGSSVRGLLTPGDFAYRVDFTGTREDADKKAEFSQLSANLSYLEQAVSSFETAIEGMRTHVEKHRKAIADQRSMQMGTSNPSNNSTSIATLEGYIEQWEDSDHIMDAVELLNILKPEVEPAKRALAEWRARNGQ